MAVASEREKLQHLAWHGWTLRIPPDWNPVRIDGDFDRGSVLLSDLASPKLAIRWRRPTARSFDADAWAMDALRDEVGRLAAEESKPHPPRGGTWRGARLYVEPEPPGRDVWVAHSQTSDRLVEIVYHATHRDRVLAERVLPAVSDQPPEAATRWSIFNFHCRVPAGMKLTSQRLVAGDLRLHFARGRDLLMLRQIGVASLALSRLPLERWFAGQQWESRRHYRPLGGIETTPLAAAGGSTLLRRPMTLRRRWLWQFRRPRTIVSLAVHDAPNDRLLILEGTDERELRDALDHLLTGGRD